MPKVLVISLNTTGPAMTDVPATLQTLGIGCDRIMVISNTSYRPLQPIAGITAPLDPSTSTMRNLLRQYDAVFVVVGEDANNNFNGYDPIINTWMQSWNEPQDPPVFHFGQNINTARTGLNLPNDFPIIRGNPSDVANTMWRWETGIFGLVSGARNRIGARVRLLREGVSIYTRAYNHRWSNECASYLIDTTTPGEGTVWEQLVVPDFPDQSRLPTPPSNRAAVFGLRYKNHYFLPAIWTSNTIAARLPSNPDARFWTNAIFWVLYALKLANIQPARRVPIIFEFDHYAVPLPNPRDYYGRSFLQQMQMYRDTYRWLVNFCKQRGTQTPFGNFASGKYNMAAVPNAFYSLIHDGSFFPAADRAAARAVCEEIRQILAQNPDVFGCGLHDHSVPGNGFNGVRFADTALERHDDTGYAYAAPNPIPTRHGSVIAQKVAPSTLSTPYTFTVAGERYLDVNPPTSTSKTYTAREGTRWTARMLIERNKADHDALGLSIKGTAGYTNLAGNRHGGSIGYWETFLENGFRGVRVALQAIVDSGNLPAGDPRNLHYRGLQFVPCVGIDMCIDCTGFYHSSLPYTSTMFGLWALETTNELRGANNEWMTSESWRQEKGVTAIRRWMASMMDFWLWTALVLRGTAFCHPSEVTWNDPANILSEPFTGSPGNLLWTGHFNFIKELMREMDNIISVLGNYLKWGTIGELMDVREEMTG